MNMRWLFKILKSRGTNTRSFMYYKSHIITIKTTEMASVMITPQRKKDLKTTSATALQTVLESTDALAKSESKDLIRFYWFSIVQDRQMKMVPKGI